MQIVIDIPNRIYKIIQNKTLNIMDAEILEKVVKNGTPLPKGHGDLIDRQALINNGTKKGFCDWYDEIKYADTIIGTVQDPKKGHWIEEDMFDGDVAYRCSECNELFWLESGTPKDNEYNFCPKCGKKLVEPQERSDKE